MAISQDNSAASPRRLKLGLVLGAGAARGWSHIGALRALERLGARPDVIVGCSSGALVAASYANGHLDALERFARALTWRGVLGYFDVTWKGGGLIEGRWLVDFFREHVGDGAIEDTPMRFAAVATELRSGRETWLTQGSVVDAVRASIALPGLVTPIRLSGQWLIDGALVNPIPVSLCRAMGADVIIAVSMQGDLVTNNRSIRAFTTPEMVAATAPSAAPQSGDQSSWLAWLGGGWMSRGAVAAAPEAPVATVAEGSPMGDEALPIEPPEEPRAAASTPPPLSPAFASEEGRPSYFDVIGDSFFTVQNFVSRVRLAADPVDILIAPELERFGLLDFHRGAEAIAAGEAAVAAQEDRLRQLLDAIGHAAPGEAYAPAEEPVDAPLE